VILYLLLLIKKGGIMENETTVTIPAKYKNMVARVYRSGSLYGCKLSAGYCDDDGLHEFSESNHRIFMARLSNVCRCSCSKCLEAMMNSNEHYMLLDLDSLSPNAVYWWYMLSRFVPNKLERLGDFISLYCTNPMTKKMFLNAVAELIKHEIASHDGFSVSLHYIIESNFEPTFDQIKGKNKMFVWVWLLFSIRGQHMGVEMMEMTGRSKIVVRNAVHKLVGWGVLSNDQKGRFEDYRKLETVNKLKCEKKEVSLYCHINTILAIRKRLGGSV